MRDRYNYENHFELSHDFTSFAIAVNWGRKMRSTVISSLLSDS